MLKLKIVCILFLFVGCDGIVVHNNIGFLKMYMKNPIDAKKKFTEALLENPTYVLARYNLSMSNLHLEQLKDSLKELNALEKVYENSPKFEYSDQLYKVYFAKGFILGLVQDIDGALASYQNALKIKPKSEEVKNNIEILTSKGSGRSKNGESDEKKEGKEGDDKTGSEGGKGDSKKGTGKGNKDNPKGRDDSSLKRKNLSKEEIKQILKEIKDQESKVRAKENKNTDRKGGPSGKTW